MYINLRKGDIVPENCRHMKTLRTIALILAAIMGALLLVGLLLPGRVSIVREIDIEAPAATVFSLANDFRQINQWSPWVHTDPNARYRTSGPARGVGATLTWEGPIVGSGSQVIVASTPFELVQSELLMDGQGRATTTIHLRQSGSATTVSWEFASEFGFDLLARYFGLMLDGIVGEDFESGLGRLKSLAESLPRADFSDAEIEHRTVDSTTIAVLAARSQPRSGAISEALGEAYFELLSFIDKHELQEAGAPMSIGGEFIGAELVFDAAIPVRGVTPDTPSVYGSISIRSSYGGRVIRVRHAGPYKTLSETHEKIAAYLAALGIARNGPSWESYVSDPTRVAEADLLTYVYYPINSEY